MASASYYLDTSAECRGIDARGGGEAMRTTTDHLLTIEEFERLPEEDAFRVELVRGRLVREPRPAALHGWVQLHLGSMLLNHVERHRRGEVFSDIGVILSTEPATVRGPDLAFVSSERLPSGPPKRGFLAFAPDLCVEIVSPSNTSAEIHERCSSIWKRELVSCGWFTRKRAPSPSIARRRSSASSR
jgi:hypothetical protein